MGFFSDVVNSVGKVIEDAAGAVVDGVATVIGTVAKIGMDIGELVDRLTTVVSEAFQVVAGDLVPNEVAKWLSVIEFLIDTAAAYPGQFLQNLETAIKTGDLISIIDVVTPAVTAAMKTARDQVRYGSLRLPEEVRWMIPDPRDRAWVEETVRYTTIGRADNKKFFYVWNFFKGDASAICLMDTIVFVDTPDFQQPATVFLALHEVKHALQFRDMGPDRFMREYLLDRAKGREPAQLEVDADNYACSIMPWGQPHYIPKCPVSPALIKRLAKERTFAFDPDDKGPDHASK